MTTRSYVESYVLRFAPCQPSESWPKELGRNSLTIFAVQYANVHSSYSPSQADATCFEAIDSAPDAAQYPHAARWYKHIATYEAEFSGLAGDASKSYKSYGPEMVGGVASRPAGDGNEDVDLFGSDEEVDPEAERIREQRLADYKARKATKPQTVAKSVVILDVKPWGMSLLEALLCCRADNSQMMRPTWRRLRLLFGASNETAWSGVPRS